MVSEAQAREVKARHGDVLRSRFNAHMIAVMRDATGNFFLKAFVRPGAKPEPVEIDGVDVLFEESQPPEFQR